MPSVQDILVNKGNRVVSVTPTATVLAATERMNQHKIGCLVVIDGGRIAGIFTERDILQRVVGEERRPSEIFVAEVMTTDVVCCNPDAEIDEVGAIMKDRRIRHVPVCDGEGQLLGLISMGDLNAYHAANQQAQIHFLNEYIYGRV